MSPLAAGDTTRKRCVLLMMATFLFVATLHATSKKPPAHPININSANSEQLQQVPGIGPATAGKILQMRKSYGPFKSVDDLLAIRGIGPKRLEKCANIWSQESRQAQSKKRQQPIPPCPRSVLDVTKAAPWSKPATLPAPLKPYRKKRGGRSPNCKRRRRARVKALVA